MRTEDQMARRSVTVSDLSGVEIPEGSGATVVIRFADERRGAITMDVTVEEALELGKSGRKQARRGRKPTGKE